MGEGGCVRDLERTVQGVFRLHSQEVFEATQMSLKDKTRQGGDCIEIPRV